MVVVKGDSRAPALLGNPAPVDVGTARHEAQVGLRVWPVNSGMAKEELYRWLRLERPTDEELAAGVPFPPGYCHFPRYGEEYFRQLTAEQLVTKTSKATSGRNGRRCGNGTKLWIAGFTRGQRRASLEWIALRKRTGKNWN